MARHCGASSHNDDLDAYQTLANQLESSRHAARTAIDELRRWRDSDDEGTRQHSIDQAINILERG